MLAREPEILRHIGRWLIDQGAPGEAVEPLSRLVAQTPTDPTARFWLARALILAKEPAQARDQIEELRKLDPELAAKVVQ